MSLVSFIEKIKNNESIGFEETIAIITEHYHYTPVEFSSGLNEHRLINPAGVNEGSCKIFAFARLNRLDPLQTLNLFGDYYRRDVLGDPEGKSHQNIRNFMKFGWEGIQFKAEALTAK
ncbi:MAG: HopJ type III effector protein [Gammaproteobacteria bacterium]